MAIANATLPNASNPGAVTQTPLTGYEVVDLIAGPVWAANTVAAIADTALSDQSVTALGTNRATAYALIANITNVTTAAASTGVSLPAATKPGSRRIVFNNGASPIQVYALGSDTIDGTAGATGVTLTNANRCQFICVASGKWLSALLGAVSA